MDEPIHIKNMQETLQLLLKSIRLYVYAPTSDKKVVETAEELLNWTMSQFLKSEEFKKAVENWMKARFSTDPRPEGMD